MVKIEFADVLKGMTGKPTNDIAALTQYFGQFHAADDGFQNIFLNGGNSSIHTGDWLYVKLSGCRFADINPDDFGMIKVDEILRGVRELEPLCIEVSQMDYTKDFSCVDELDTNAKELFTAANKSRGTDPKAPIREPSVEAALHAQLSGTEKHPRWNMHDHNTVINGWVCSNQAEETFRKLYGGNDVYEFVDFVEPGTPLSIFFNRVVKRWKDDKKDPQVIFMGQHGRMITSYSERAVNDFANETMRRAQQLMKDRKKDLYAGMDNFARAEIEDIVKASDYVRDCFNNMGQVQYHTDNDYLMGLLNSEKGLREISQGMPNPDAVVHGGVAPMVVFRPGKERNGDLFRKIIQARQDYEKRFTHDKPVNADGSLYLPRIVLIEGLCAVTMSAEEDPAKARKKANNAYESLIDTVYLQRGATAFGGMKPLSHQHLFYITNWAAEKRRQDKVAQ